MVKNRSPNIFWKHCMHCSCGHIDADTFILSYAFSSSCNPSCSLQVYVLECITTPSYSFFHFPSLFFNVQAAKSLQKAILPAFSRSHNVGLKCAAPEMIVMVLQALSNLPDAETIICPLLKVKSKM